MGILWFLGAAAEAADSYASGPYQNGRYEYEPYNLGKMDPQLTGWPLSSAARAFCNIGESSRWPGKEPGGTGQTAANMAKIPTTPGAQGGDWWLKNHENLVGVVDRYIRDRGTRVDVLLLGDSITQQWLGFTTPFSGYDVAAKMQPFNAAWKSNFPGLTAVSLGVAGDRTQSLLWRLDHDGPRTLEPRVVVVAIGHNNMFFTGPTRESNPGATGTDAAARGVLCVVQNVLARFPNSKVLVVKVLPCFDQNAAFYKQAQLINSQIDTLNLESHPRVHLLDSLLVNVLKDRPMWDAWVDATGNPKPELFRTGAGEPVHPSQDQGYSLYASKLKGPVQHLLNQPGTFYFSAPEFTAAENAGEIRIAVRRLSGGSGPASVEFETGDGTAIAGTDYLATSGVLTWKPDETGDKFVTLRLKDNAVPGTDRTLQISLRNPQGETLGYPSSAQVRIEDDEQPGRLAFSPAQTLQAFENGGPLTLRVQRSAGRSGAVTVQYAVTGISAVAGADFTPVSGTLRWEDGDASEKEIVVPILDDSSAEPVENFRVVLSGVTGAALGELSQLEVEIIDEDPKPLDIYSEGTGAGWVPNGWSSTIDPQSSGNGIPPQSGTKVCAATITGAGGAAGFFFQAAGGLDLRTYQSVTFWLHGGTQGGQSLRLMPYSSTPSAGKLLSPPLAAGRWQKYTVTLAELSQTNVTDLSALRFVDQAGASVGRTFYADDIQLDLRPSPTGALPTVSTLPPTQIQATGATLAGNASSAGDSPISSKGLCWSLTRNPTRADSRTDAGTGPGEFQTTLGGLPPGSRYHVRAYAVSAIGTSYGENREFTLPAPASTPVAGDTLASFLGTQTVLTSTLQTDGGTPLTQRGFAWGPISKPVTEWILIHTAAPLYNATLTGLTPATEYGARAYALNDAGLSYGPVTRFTAPRAGNLPPVALPMALVTLEDQPLPLTLAGTDSDGSIASYAVASGPINGALSGTPPNLVYTPASNFNGSDTFTFTVTDAQGATSAPATVSLSVTPVNDAPSFTKGANQSVPFNSPARTIPGWATGIHPGAPNESTQTLAFQVSNNNPALFSAAPALAANGTLSFTPAQGKSGTATLTVLLKDNGGVSNGGKDSSLPQSFDITIGENTKPVASPMALVTLEDQPLPLTLAGTDSDGSIASYTVASGPINGALSGTPPNLVYTPASNFNGSDTFTFTVTDAQGATSAAATVTLSVTPVNDAPGFTKGPNPIVGKNAGPQTVRNWASIFHAGPENESGQGVTLSVSTTSPDLFSAPPQLDTEGTLTFTPARNKAGSALVTVLVQDNGGQENGGQDSFECSFEIRITEIFKASGIYSGLVRSADGPNSLSSTGFIRVSIARTGALSGRILVGGVSTAFTGKFDDSGIPRFGSRKLLELPLATRRRPAPLLSLRMELDQTPIVMRGVVRIGETPLSVLEALRELGSIRPLTAEEKGAFSLPSNRTYYLGAPLANAGNPEASRPHGHGHGMIRSFAGGSVRMAGVMADGRSISASAAIQENGSWPLYAVPAGSSGALFGTVQVRSLPGSSDMDSACLQWFMPENPRRSTYRTGWPAGLTLDLRAAVYRAPVRMAREGALTGAGAPRTEGNAQLRIGPDQGESLWRHALNVDAASKVWIQAPNALRLTVDPKTGFWRGSYLHPEIRKWVPFRGVIQQESRIGAGMEWGMEGSRPVVLEPTPQLAAPGPSNVP